MERISPQHRAEPLRWDEPECVAIRKHWPGLSGPDKLAWLYLWDLSRRGLDEISVTAAMVAEDQGTCGDAGLTRLKNLAKAGLLGTAHQDYWWDKGNGRWRIRLPHPFDIGWQIVRANPDQPTQLQFEFLRDFDTAHASETGDRRISQGQFRAGHVTSEEAPAEIGASSGRFLASPRGSAGASSEPPGASTARAPSEPSETVFKFSPLTFGQPSEPSERVTTPSAPAATQNRGSAGGTSEEAALLALVANKRASIQREQATQARRVESQHVAAQTARAATEARVANPQVQQRHVEELITFMMGVVNDPTMKVKPLAELARHVVYGAIDHRKLSAAMRDLAEDRRAGKVRSSVGYFVGIRNRLYREAGIPIPEKKSPR